MNAATFDTLKSARALKSAGIDGEHAEAIASQLREAASADRADLATNADVAAVKSDVAAVKGDVAALNASLVALNANLAALRGEMPWMLGFQGALILAIAAKLFGIV